MVSLALAAEARVLPSAADPSAASLESIRCPTAPELTALLNTLRRDHSLVDEDENYLSGEALAPHLRSCRRITMAGESEPVMIFEYHYRDGLPAFWPWRYQVLFRRDGQYLGQIEAWHVRSVVIPPLRAPYLLATLIHRRGEGGHQLFRIKNGTLFKAFDSDAFGFEPKTYNADKFGDEANRPYEFALRVRDVNGDGWNDLIFTGIRLYRFIRTGANGEAIYRYKRQVHYLFFYNPKSGMFNQSNSELKKFITLD
jgi:hypothetical protein